MTTPQSLLAAVEAAISNLLQAMSSDTTQEYSYGNRSWKRADFPRLLEKLFDQRDRLKREVAASNRRIHLGSPRRGRR